MAERKFGNMELTGKSAEILAGFSVPDDVARRIARRSGALIGSRITHEEVTELIIENLRYNGVPNWESVEYGLAVRTKRAYRSDQGKTNPY